MPPPSATPYGDQEVADRTAARAGAVRERRSRHTRLTRRLVSLAAAATLALGLAVTWPLPARVAAAGSADPQALEVVRLMNGERAYRRLPALRVDPFLAARARDVAIACPNNASLVMSGRAKDFALNGGFSPSSPHSLRLCPTQTVLDVMQRTWGYTQGAIGENVATNSGYGTGRVTYGYGCTNNKTSGCPGPQTYTYYTTARVSANFMSSSIHRAIVLGSFDRVGCGAWISSGGAFYYSCLFSRGGPNATVAPPGGSPFGAPPPPPVRTPRPLPPPTRPPVSPTVRPASAATPCPPAAATAKPSAAPSAPPTASVALPPAVPDPSATASPLAVAVVVPSASPAERALSALDARSVTSGGGESFPMPAALFVFTAALAALAAAGSFWMRRRRDPAS